MFIVLDENDLNVWMVEGEFVVDIVEVVILEFEFWFGLEDWFLSMLGSVDFVYFGDKWFEVCVFFK